MISLRPAAERGHFRIDWLDSQHTFSFGHYHDPRFMGFGPLRVINQDIVQPGKGFARHGHQNMEIISYVIHGGLAHQDSLGTGSVIRPGEIQRMRAGTGIEHSEFNASQDELVQFLQIWVQPDRLGLQPGYAQQDFPLESRRNQLKLLASGYGEEGVIEVRQNMRMFGGLFDAGHTADYAVADARGIWIQLIRGTLQINHTLMQAGDGLAARHESSLSIRASQEAEFLLFDLPIAN
ncbi:quercetin 2,3-dioxygenase [Ahniella affigens]|uniref:Quercetin 2,3-dioxygenase n=1 Tax=Ahniella affigens TaxID=2021234 RepID=A0A2P1PXI5_9GAMM|nr:pirin family protein [Ahniella affigens]AVP99561.1 quercetin 2,3-dioxygenase [Ahniella affigens]